MEKHIDRLLLSHAIENFSLKMTMLTENVIISDENVGGFYVTPRVPRGLAAAVESLTREVIRERPKDIYTFAAQHFENLLRQREYCRYNTNNDDDMTMSRCNNIHEWSHDRITRITKKYDKKMIQDSPMIALLRQPYKQKIDTTNIDTKIWPKISTGMQVGTNVNIESRKNSISESNNKITINSNIDEVKKRVVNKFATAKSLNELQGLNYVSEVQEIIDNVSRPVLNKKLELLKRGNNVSSDNFVVRLDETRTLLEDISSCFPTKNNGCHRPHSADSAQHYDKRLVTEKLQTMLSETHNLLVDISTSFLNGSLSSGQQTLKNGDKNNIHVSSTLPAVRSPVLSPSSILGNNNTQNTEDDCNTKNNSKILALPPVMTNSTNGTVPIMGRSIKTEEDLTLPLLSSTIENKSNHVNHSINYVDSTESIEKTTNEDNFQDNTDEFSTVLDEHQKTEHVPDDNESVENIKIFNPESNNISTELVKENLLCDDNQVDLTAETGSTSTIKECGSKDPSYEVFGEVITTTPSTTVGPLENVMESLVGDLSSISSMMNQVVQLHHPHVDLGCINEEEDAIEEISHVKEENDDESIIKIEEPELQGDLLTESVNWQDTNAEPENECHDETDLSSSAKETSVTDGLILGSITNIEQSATVNDDSVSLECESSNEAKETTLTDGISLSLDEPLRPFVPELNLDSLQDVTVSSFKMTEDEQYDENTNSVVETPTSSHPDYQNDTRVSGSEINECSFNHAEMSPMESKVEKNNDQSDHVELESNRGDIDTPLGDISRSESRCTTRRVNSGNLTWPRENSTLIVDKHWEEMKITSDDDTDVEPIMNDQLRYIAAVCKIQAGIRGFLARQRRRLKSTSNGNDSYVSEAVVTGNEDVQVETEKMKDTLEDTAVKRIRSEVRGHHTGKRLCRENAIIQRTTTKSMEDERNIATDLHDMIKGNGLQHTGEFHDWIVLPFYDHQVTAMNEECKVRKEAEEQAISDSTDSSNSLQVNSETTVQNNEMQNIVEYGKSSGDIKSFSPLPVFHFGLNKNIADVIIDHLILISNNEMIPVQDSHHNRGLESSTSSPLKEGVIIEEITDTPSEMTQIQEQVKTTVLESTDSETLHNSHGDDQATTLSTVKAELSSSEQDSENSSISKKDNTLSSTSLLLANNEKVLEVEITEDGKITDRKKDDDP